LKKEYSTIGDINIKDESELQKLVEGYDISHSWRFIIYNDKIGYLDFGYTSSPTAGEGFVYRVELIGNVLNLYLVNFWLS